MRVICLRHGESEYNLLGLCNDDPARDVALTDAGRTQAAAAAERLQGEGIQAIFSSELPRALQTAAIVNERLGLAVTSEPRLNDIRTGFDVRPVVEYLAAIDHDPFDARMDGGESLREHFARVQGFLSWLDEQPYAAVLLANTFTPLLDATVQPRVLGQKRWYRRIFGR